MFYSWYETPVTNQNNSTGYSTCSNRRAWCRTCKLLLIFVSWYCFNNFFLFIFVNNTVRAFGSTLSLPLLLGKHKRKEVNSPVARRGRWARVCSTCWSPHLSLSAQVMVDYLLRYSFQNNVNSLSHFFNYSQRNLK